MASGGSWVMEMLARDDGRMCPWGAWRRNTGTRIILVHQLLVSGGICCRRKQVSIILRTRHRNIWRRLRMTSKFGHESCERVPRHLSWTRVSSDEMLPKVHCLSDDIGLSYRRRILTLLPEQNIFLKGKREIWRWRNSCFRNGQLMETAFSTFGSQFTKYLLFIFDGRGKKTCQTSQVKVMATSTSLYWQLCKRCIFLLLWSYRQLPFCSYCLGSRWKLPHTGDESFKSAENASQWFSF